jgi:hypothetical protein
MEGYGDIGIRWSENLLHIIVVPGEARIVTGKKQVARVRFWNYTLPVEYWSRIFIGVTAV